MNPAWVSAIRRRNPKTWTRREQIVLQWYSEFRRPYCFHCWVNLASVVLFGF